MLVLHSALEGPVHTDLVLRALNSKRRLGSLSTLYRWLVSSGPVTLSNAELAEQLQVGAPHLRRCVKTLERLGLVVASYAADGNKNTRRLSVTPVDRWVRGVLKQIIAGTVTLDLETASVTRNDGLVLDATSRTFMLEGANAMLEGSDFPCSKASPPCSKGVDSRAARAATRGKKPSCSKGLPPEARLGRGGKGVMGAVDLVVGKKDQEQNVETPGSAVEVRTVMNSSELFIDPVPTTQSPVYEDALPASNALRKFFFGRLSPARQAAIGEVLDHWAATFHYGPVGIEHSEVRRMAVNNRLKTFTVEQLKALFECALANPQYNDHPRSEVTWLCGTDKRVTRILRVQPRDAALQAEVMQVIKGWQDAMQFLVPHTASQSRQSIVHARLKDGFTVEQLITIAQHIAKNPWYRGANDRATAYDGIDSIYRSADRCEKHLENIARGRTGNRAVVDRTHMAMAATPGKPSTGRRF